MAARTSVPEESMSVAGACVPLMRERFTQGGGMTHANAKTHIHTPHRTPRLVRLAPQHTPGPSVRGPALSHCEWLA